MNEPDTPIVRHTKIKATANPHSPSWDKYLELHWGKKMLKSTQGRTKAYRISRQQGRLCPICHRPVTTATSRQSHFSLNQLHGGTDAAVNLKFIICAAPKGPRMRMLTQ